MRKLKVIEAFSGIGSQAKALERLKEKDSRFAYEVVATVEWEIGAMYAYDILHNGPQDLSIYDKLSKKEILKKLDGRNLSSDGKNPMSFEAKKRMSELQLKSILHSIENTNNLVDISMVSAEDLPDADLLTYSFPCQDLSISSYWHKNFSGINKGANNRSGLLWEIERILKECEKIGKELPRFLLMENVTAINSPMHSDNFELWKKELKRLGYHNYTYNLNAKDFGVPQSRIRTYMLSVLVKGNPYVNEIDLYMENKTRLFDQVEDFPDIRPYLRLNYEENPKYEAEARASIPNFTDSRKAILNDSVLLAIGTIPTGYIARTITTKQDRNPNAGLIQHNLDVKSNQAPFRYLTPRETFLLMGFDEEDYELLDQNNPKISSSRRLLSFSKLLKLTGNSIVVNVLEAVFSEMYYLNDRYFENHKVLSFIKREA